MNVISRIGFLITFLVSTCFAGLTIKTTDPAASILVEAVVKICESCYGNRITPVGLAGSLAGVISKGLSSREDVPVTLIDDDARIVDNGPVHGQSRKKLQVFVVTASSSQALTRTLKQIKASIWWNHMARFLILEVPSTDTGCSNAFELLWAAWDMNILNANLMCHHRSKGRLMYTFNPYTRLAPDPWEFVETYRGKNNHPWALFVRGYKEAKGICEGLNFEKANDLGGYELRVSVVNGTRLYNITGTRGFCFNPIADIYCDILLPALNGTPKIRVRPLSSLGIADGKGNVTGILGDVAHGVVDCSLIGRFMPSTTNLTFAYPHKQRELRSMTQYSGYKSQLSKILSIIDRPSRICLLLVCAVTLIFFKVFKRESVTVALLNTLRIICNSSLTTVPGNLGPRIYLGCLFAFVVTMQGIFQGKLASLLTNEEPLRNVNTMKDLSELDYTIYVHRSLAGFIKSPELEERLVEIDEFKCTDQVLESPRASCVASAEVTIFDAGTFELHMSADILASMHEAMPIRPDWPLEERINTLLMRSVDTHQILYLFENITSRANRRLMMQEEDYRKQSIKAMTLEQLGFAFAILAIGIGCATVTFVIEVILG